MNPEKKKRNLSSAGRRLSSPKLNKAAGLLDIAEKDLKKFEKTRNFALFTRTCIKGWAAFNLLLEQKAGRKLKVRERRPAAKQLGLHHEYISAQLLYLIRKGSIAYWDEQGLLEDAREGMEAIRKVVKVR